MASSIRRETKQHRPFQSLGQEAVVALLRTASLLRRQFELLMQEHGLTFQQFNVLRILRGADAAGEGALPTMEVAERMIEPEPGITRLMGRLEAKGVVAREQSNEDARRVLCRITPSGLAALDDLDAAVTALDNEILGPLSETDLRTILRLLDRVREPLTGER